MRQFAVAFALTFGAANAVAGQAVSLAGALHIDPDAVKEWKVPWERTTPRDPFVGRNCQAD